MNTLTIDKKKFVVVPQKDYEELLIRAAKKTSPTKKMSLVQGKKRAYKLTDKWAAAK